MSNCVIEWTVQLDGRAVTCRVVAKTPAEAVSLYQGVNWEVAGELPGGPPLDAKPEDTDCESVRGV